MAGGPGKHRAMGEAAANACRAGAIWLRWWIVGLAGALWMLLGLFLLANAFLGGPPTKPAHLAIALVADAVVSLAATFAQAGMSRGKSCVKTGFFLAIAIVIVATPGRAEMASGILAGLFLITDAGWRATHIYRVRPDRWRRAVVYVVIEALVGLWALVSYPAQGVVASDVSVLVLNSASQLGMFAARLRRLSQGAPAPRAVPGRS